MAICPTLIFYTHSATGRVETKIQYMKKCLLLTAVVFLGTFTAAIAQVPSYVPADGLVGWWPFNGNAADESGNGHDCSVVEAVLGVDRFGNSSNSYELGGSTGYVRTNNPFYNSSIDHTVSFWIQVADSADQNVSFFNTDPHTIESFGYNYVLNPARHFHFFLGNGVNGIAGWNIALNNSFIGQPPLPNFNNWFNYTVVLEGLQWRFYINGELVNTFNSTQTTGNVLADLFFGNDVTNTAAINGSIDDIAVYNRALTEEEIQNLYIGCNVAPTAIAGNLSPATLTSTSYACNNNPGSTYQWNVTNGIITAGQGTGSVTVLWGEEGAGTLSVVETNAEGCSGATSTIDVNVVCATTATAIDGPLGPNALTSTTYTCNGVAGSSYQWTISNGVITTGQGTNSVTVLWAGTGLGTISVQETTSANCSGDVISLDVVVIPTSVEEQQDLSIALFPNPASNEVTLTASEGLRGKIYTIFSSTGQAVMTGALSSRTVIDLQGLASGTYTLVVEDTLRKTLSIVQE
jgi:hypothetical protein